MESTISKQTTTTVLIGLLLTVLIGSAVYVGYAQRTGEKLQAQFYSQKQALAKVKDPRVAQQAVGQIKQTVASLQSVATVKPNQAAADGFDPGLVMYCGWLADQIADAMTSRLASYPVMQLDNSWGAQVIGAYMDAFFGAGCQNVFGWAV